MPAHVTLRLGDMFEGATDLIVLPCSTVPTVTEFVSERLRRFQIPLPQGEMRLGQVEFVPFRGAENVASFVGWAASVRGRDSTLDAIEEIGRAVGQFTRENRGVELVSAPLLGTGAGGLEGTDVVQRLRDGFLATAADAATLQLYVMDPQLFETLRANIEHAPQGGTEETVDEPIRVFLSYTRTESQHAEWVKSLATFLRSNGINARLDQWHLHLGADVAQWMTNELDQAQRVLLICNEEYAQRADRRHGGVGWEIRIVQGDMLSAPPENDKYIAVVHTERVEDGLPIFLKSSYSLHWPPSGGEDAKRDELLKALYEHNEEPPLGPPPLWLRPGQA